MANTLEVALWKFMSRLFQAHPWHGIAIGEDAPHRVNAYIEIVPTDSVKYEVDKASGHLCVDRPQKYSSQCPTLYGFIPQTYCGTTNAAYCAKKTGRPSMAGDLDPLDICVLTEKLIPRGDILVTAVPIGGIRMIDGNEADDKIIAVLDGDAVYGKWKDISECPKSIVERLRHYFLTYKDIPGQDTHHAEVTDVYGAEEAHEVIRLSRADYREAFRETDELLALATGGAELKI